MTDQHVHVEPSEVLLDRLRAARRARGFTQQDVAERLGIARTTLVAIEKGERPVRPQELVELARLYDRPLNELMRPALIAEDFVAQFRLRPGETKEESQLAQSVELLQELADDYVELERLAGAPLPQRYPPELDISSLPPAAAGETLAASERNRLGLGDAPVHHLRPMLEGDVGLRIFFLPLPSRVAGLFVASATYGACIGINTGHPGERQRWSLTHEYAHFLAQRSRSEVTVLHGYQRVPTAERFADAFAENFLLPASGVKRRFHELRQSGREQVTPADLLHLADLFQVSLEAMVRRLENLDLLRPHTWDRLVKQGFRVGEARKMLELAALPPDAELLPLRYRYLAVEAYLEGDISEGQFARFLRTDRTAARKLAQQLSHRIGMDETGAISDVELGAFERADVANG
jgi:Zn-dependent peptidase ImmA (M78 family)/transcriptional regulator with XRE-family HTH domain